MGSNTLLQNYVNGSWVESSSTEQLNVLNPATGDVLARVPLSTLEDVDRSAKAAANAFTEWRFTPPTQRVQHLFKLKSLLEDHADELSKIITMENGKTLAESRGELQRAIENVEVACGIPTLMQGDFLEDIGANIDEFMIRQPVGVCSAITPFNFPAMIVFWFLPYAIACGNTFIVKPSEKVPLTMQKIFELLDRIELPPGVVNLIHGSNVTSNAILEHPTIRAISFVGSTPIAKYVYSQASSNGKRVQAQGGAKNPIIILPDADIDATIQASAESAFGCAGQRCLAASVLINVGSARKPFTDAIAEAAKSRKVGYGLDNDVEMGPVITEESKARIEGLIQQSESEGSNILVDGRSPSITGFNGGSFVRPTILDNVHPNSKASKTEIFGPVLSIINAETIDDAISLVNSGDYGNMACLFTNSGGAARKFRYEAEAGNIGINIGVAAPMAFFPFSGWKDSFFGTLHGQASHAVEFFTQTKIVVERWPT